MLERQCIDACHQNQVDQVRTLVQRGCDPNEESQRGMTPLLCYILNDAPSECMEELITMKADINLVNKFGLSALMLAARLKDARAVHLLMKRGASALRKVGINANYQSFLCFPPSGVHVVLSTSI
jgi:ankyrin repeat protein